MLRVTLATSAARVQSRGLREGETMKGPDLESHTGKRHLRDTTVTSQAIEKLGALAPVVWVEADDSKDKVHDRFKAAIGQLALEATLIPN